MCVIMCIQQSLNWGLAFHSDWERIVIAQGDLALPLFGYLPTAKVAGSTAYYNLISTSCCLWQLAILSLQVSVPTPTLTVTP